MEKLQGNSPGLHESWRELAEHALTHDNLPVKARGDEDVNPPMLVKDAQ